MHFRAMAVALGLFLIAAYAIVISAQADDDDDEGRFVATLSGNEEVPARDTRASGKAQFRLDDDRTELRFKLSVNRINNVFAAHIHCGTPGVNGPVGVTLFMGTPGGGRFSGTLSRGVITAPDAGNACGWTTFAAVLAAIESGATYVNVHTNDGVGDPNTGPGDFPGGEIRGHVVSDLDDDDDTEFRARLSGTNEVPPRDTNARGDARIRVNEDGTELHFRVTVRHITNVFMAHIHCAAPGVNGPIGVTLYGVAPTGGGPHSGVLVIAMKTAPDPNNACGWEDLGDVITAMEGGNTYVNVHTNDGVDPANTGPGDFPGGELRGQLKASDDDD